MPPALPREDGGLAARGISSEPPSDALGLSCRVWLSWQLAAGRPAGRPYSDVPPARPAL